MGDEHLHRGTILDLKTSEDETRGIRSPYQVTKEGTLWFGEGKDHDNVSDEVVRKEHVWRDVVSAHSEHSSLYMIGKGVSYPLLN